ncbi:hypothetical protein PAHAL_9G217500 [Panicum hallii]|uniref:Uncharacterized protein n=1 Tax=Panicum hallii TaxID=206008 RepID=A0A2S3ILC6_9POAL|nr:hypothetical protein PAHAL_9G217500 [Panicum hallii]
MTPARIETRCESDGLVSAWLGMETVPPPPRSRTEPDLPPSGTDSAWRRERGREETARRQREKTARQRLGREVTWILPCRSCRTATAWESGQRVGGVDVGVAGGAERRVGAAGARSQTLAWPASQPAHR